MKITIAVTLLAAGLLAGCSGTTYSEDGTVPAAEDDRGSVVVTDRYRFDDATHTVYVRRSAAGWVECERYHGSQEGGLTCMPITDEQAQTAIDAAESD